MREQLARTKSVIESWPSAHQGIIGSFYDKVGGIRAVKKIAAASLDQGQYLIVVTTVKTHSERVWNRIWDAEYETGHEFEGTVINFLELDANQELGATEIDHHLERGVEFETVFERKSFTSTKLEDTYYTPTTI
mgnify:CR=1 FL=1